MPRRAPWSAPPAVLLLLLLLLSGLPRARACPHPCACYVPSEVHCTFRSLASVPAGISRHVERINLGFNSIQALSETSFAGLAKLELLLMHGNEIPNIPDGALRDLSSLQVLKFSYNKLRVITKQTLQGLTSLLRLHLDHNRLEFIHPQAFEGLTGLRLLHLEGNQLRQLHPGTFSTFTFLDYFRLSTVRHLYLADNQLSALPRGMLDGMPLLENLFLHGNPWVCDCSLDWFSRWEAGSKGTLKCKKDKSYEGGQLCATCSSPRKLQGRELHGLGALPCLKPAITSPLRHNHSAESAEDLDSEEEDPDPPAPRGSLRPSWNISLNMTDEHGNSVALLCAIQEPAGVRAVQLNLTDAQELELNATVALDIECPMTRENYEKLWKLIAYYSDVPLQLQREQSLGGADAALGYHYRQDPDADALYYTGVRARVLAQPAWVLQPRMDIQLDRRQSSATTVRLSYQARHAATLSPKDARRARARSWVMIEPSAQVPTAQAVLEGGAVQLSCHVKASESPSILWVLPDGSLLKAPGEDPRGRFSALTSGWLRLKAAELADSGAYRCVAQVRDELDQTAYRVLVLPAAPPPPAAHAVTLQKAPGEPLQLPCDAQAIPEAQLSWVLPSGRIVSSAANASHAHLMADGTLSIPQLQASDAGYYRCVAVNQQGADHFSVGIAVAREGPSGAPKRGRVRAGGKARSRGRVDVVEDEGGSGLGEQDGPARHALHPKDQELFIQTSEDTPGPGRIPKKGRRKLKLWKNPEKEPETTVAEGRRVFESRRRVHVASKQINPEQWANILARVRGKSPAKGAEAPQGAGTTPAPPGTLEATPPLPALPPPSVVPEPSSIAAEESSADVALGGEEDEVSSTILATQMEAESGHEGVFLAEPTLAGTDLEEFTDPEASEQTEVAATRDSGLGDTTGFPQLPLTEESTPHGLDTLYEEPTGEHRDTGSWTSIDVESGPQPTATGDESPLHAGSLAEAEAEVLRHQDLETTSHAEEDDMDGLTATRMLPTPTWQDTGPWTAGPLEDPAWAEEDAAAPAPPTGLPDHSQVVAGSVLSHSVPLSLEDTQEGSRAPQNEHTLEEGPTESTSPENERQWGLPTALLDPTLPASDSTSPFKQPGEATAATPGDQEATTVTAMTSTRAATSASVLTTHPSPKRPHGRRRQRPFMLRHRHRHRPAPPATSAPPETFSAPAPGVANPERPESRLAPTAWVASTAGVPQKLETEKPTEPVTKGPPRRKHRKKPHKQRRPTSTVSPSASVTQASSSPERRPKTPGSGTDLAPPTASLRPGAPREGNSVEASAVTPTKIHSSHGQFRESSSATSGPPSGGRDSEGSSVTNISDREKDSLVPGESAVDAMSSSDSGVATVGEFKEQPPPSGFPGTPSWGPSRTEQPGRLQTDTAAVASSSEDPTDSPFFRGSEDVGLPSEVPPSSSMPPLFQQREAVASTTDLSIRAESSSTQAGTTSSDVGHHKATPMTIPSETGPHNPIPTPLEEPTSPAPTPVSLAPTVQEPVPLPSKTSSPSEDSQDNVVLNSVGIPETKTSPVLPGGTWHIQRPDESSTSSSKQGEVHLTPKQELGQETPGGRTPNSLPFPPGGHHQERPVQVFHHPARIPARPTPPRGTARPPPVTTQGSFRYFVTFQPPRHVTNKPGITAYPSRVLPENNKHVTAPKLPSTGPVVPARGSRPGELTDRGADWLNGNSKVFGSNSIPDLRDPVVQLPSSRVPHGSGGRVPFFFNRSLSFPQLGVTSKPRTPNPPSLVLRKVTPGPYQRGHTQGIIHVDFGPPAPPILHAPQTTAAPSTHFPSGPLFSTRSSVPFVTSSSQSSRNGHQSSAKFWPLGEKPRIITKSPQTVTVPADTDIVLPCEATGTPKPFVTWTKVSTGALLAPNTRLQRFEVLKNGTLVIRRAQAQDRGQYQCTAQNLHGADRMLVRLSVALQQPQILASQHQDVTVYLGDTIAMECLAQGTPAPQISWIFPDGTVWRSVSPAGGRVTLHQNRTLSIRDAGFADRGAYRCVASNAAGADSLAIRLHVAALPPLIQQEKLENISLPPGLSVHIHCSAQAAPPPSVRWVLADGTHIRPSQFLRGSTFVFPNGTLYMRHLAPKDSGRYECVAANLVGSARRTVHLSVQRAAANARITGSSPQRTDVRYGGTLRLDCSASGDPWPRILWRLPSKRMIDSLFSFDPRVKVFTNGTLLVRSVTEKDAGDYLCVARNKVGDDFVLLQVNVVMKAAKIEHKEENDHRVFFGGDLKVDCVASGLPNPEISWGLPDGSLVNPFMQADDSGGRAKRYVVFNNGTLFFNDVGPREQGDYTCFAQNQVGKDEMRVRVKVVAEPAAIRNKTPAVLQVPYGGVASVACEAKGEPPPRVTWLSPSLRPIPASSDKYRVFPDGRLLIQKAQRADSGNYTCVARNSAGEDRHTVWVQVSVRPPRINGHPDAVTTVREIAARGGRTLLDCRAEGVPAPRVLWALPEGVVLPAPYRGHRVSIHANGTLDIRGLRASDSGQLACIARNEGGEARLLVQLTVLEPLERPRFHDPLSEKITATAGHTISLNCSAAGAPAPSLRWVLPNGTELPSGQRLQRLYHKADGRLHISGLAAGDAGTYRCVARNSAGRAERLVSLRVDAELTPDRSRQYRNLVSIVAGETLRLHCRPPRGGRTRISWTLPGGLVLDGAQARGRVSLADNGTLTVREASVFDRGTYACRADTDAGPALVTIPVIVIAYPPRITSEPTPVIYARPGHSVKMNCTAMAIPAAQLSWELPDRAQLAVGEQARVYGNKFLHPQGSLSVQHISARDAGFYRCVAKNILGTDSKTTYLHVY
ncbi:matrix-remodeling-associated protein 5 [Talpa occidentalis]|uniref:matrix-remodeling-associated protein 5 n=1 Tax=Talpa occidentalis TaxID=50954 RepID=UPI00188F9BE3|nr:matrix-remodeling-associated protein 5 [Talpa occidentalis]